MLISSEMLQLITVRGKILKFCNHMNHFHIQIESRIVIICNKCSIIRYPNEIPLKNSYHFEFHIHKSKLNYENKFMKIKNTY